MEYRTTVLPPRRFRVMVLAVLAVGIACSAVIWLFRSADLFACVFSTVVLVGAPAALVSGRGIIAVDADALRLTLVPLLRKTVPLREVESVRVASTDPWRDYYGIGYRLVRGGEVGFVFQRGPAVHVHTRGGRLYVVGDPDAAELAAALERGAAATGEHGA